METQTRSTTWLKSPLQKRIEKLKIGMEVEIRPYTGRKRRVRLARTEYRIGTDPECGIMLDDPFVSRRHATLHLDVENGAFAIRNECSRNGVYFNGVHVEHAVLPSRGVLRLGRSEIRWSDEDAAAEDFGEMRVGDEGMREMLGKLREVARSDLPVLILGETGTGKELIARLVHQWSHRASQQLVALNAALLGSSLAESELFGHRKGAFTGAVENRRGAIGMAHRGSLFLDEIADIPPSAQVKLLRTLESGELKAIGSDQLETSDFRLISATSRPLESALRSDLYYRIAGYVVEVPPLRSRPKDVVAIARARAGQAGVEIGEGALQKLLSYRWPGNIRELKSVLARGIVSARASGSAVVGAEHFQFDRREYLKTLPTELTEKLISLEELEKEFILSRLERNDWSRKITAEQLGISRSTLFKKMGKYGIATVPQGCGSRRPKFFPGAEAGRLGV